MSHSKVASFMRVLDLFVLPSTPVRTSKIVWEEQFGHVLIEAMACGVPVFGSTSGAIPEVIGEPEGIFPYSDANALAELIQRAINSPSWLQELAQRQRERTVRLFSDEAVAHSYATFLKAIKRSKERNVGAKTGRDLDEE
jgi:glycosyltransferase involved in cell wall biosynthesis